MGRKTKLTIQYLLAGIFVMLFTAMFFTKDYVLSEPEEADTDDVAVESVEDGTYTGTSNGFGGDLEVEVTVEDGNITDVIVLDHSESVDEAEEVMTALEDLPADIVEANSADVDTVSGATVTSDAIRQAVANALSGDEGDSEADTEEDADAEQEEEEEKEPKIDLDAIEEEDVTYEDGTYTGSAEGFGDDDLEVEVTIEDGKIKEVLITENSETEQVAEDAFELVPEAIQRRNSADVDTVSGATVTSEAIIEAVENALEDAQ